LTDKTAKEKPYERSERIFLEGCMNIHVRKIKRRKVNLGFSERRHTKARGVTKNSQTKEYKASFE